MNQANNLVYKLDLEYDKINIICKNLGTRRKIHGKVKKMDNHRTNDINDWLFYYNNILHNDGNQCFQQFFYFV